MMMIEPKIDFKTSHGEELLLESVHYDVFIDGLMAKTAIIQNYKNPYDENIEAIYTFPLSVDAILLGVEIKINDRLLKGKIIEKSEAEERYEKAIDDGDRAIMIEKSSDGIYTVNIANLLSQDSISVIIEYTQLLVWKQNQVKWQLPTTIAPKYGNPAGLNLDDVTDPSISLLAENLFSFNMIVRGVLADSDIVAPSHQVDIDKNELNTKVTLKNDKDFMNKDIVFTFKTMKSKEERSFALLGKSLDGYSAIASFYPSFGSDFVKKSKSVTFVVDCSGSMNGVSINSAKTAMHKALELFNEGDSFNIIKFGSHYDSLFEKEVLATEENIAIARSMVNSLSADMGGTEMPSALQSAYNGHDNSRENSYLFLITDGEIYDHKNVIENAKRSEMAHFVVGVGYASDDALLKSVADETKGSYENVDPNEYMDTYIINQFKKIDTPKATHINITWAGETKFQHSPNIVFDGDTIYAYAEFDTVPFGDVELTYELENGNTYTNTTAITHDIMTEETSPSVISKIVFSKEMDRAFKENSDEKVINYSTDYQLFSELTNFILVDETTESEKPLTAPVMYKVDNMMVENCMIQYSMEEPEMCMKQSSESFVDECHDELVYPSFLENRVEDNQDLLANIPSYKYERYLLLFNDWFMKNGKLPIKIEQLQYMGIDEYQSVHDINNFIKALYEICDDKSALDEGFVQFLSATV